MSEARPGVLERLRNGRRTLLGAAAVGLLGSGAHALLAPAWYTSHLTVVAETSRKPGAALPGLAGAADILDQFSGNPDVERIAGVFRSDAVADHVIEKLDLKRHYGLRYVEKAREELWRHCTTRSERRPGFVTLTCEDKEPAFARDLVALLGERANEVLRQVSVTSAGEERRFLERRLTEARKEVDLASQELRAFQEKHKIVDLTEQAKAVVATIASLTGRAMSRELELGYRQSLSTRDEAAYRREIGAVESRLRTLEEPAGAGDDGPATEGKRRRNAAFPPMLAIPRLRYELDKLVRSQKVAETVLELVQQRLEMAKANEARDTSAFQVLDPPRVAGYKSSPSRAAILVGETALAVFLSALWLALAPWLRRHA